MLGLVDGEVDVGRRGLATHLLLAPLTGECLGRCPGEARPRPAAEPAAVASFQRREFRHAAAAFPRIVFDGCLITARPTKKLFETAISAKRSLPHSPALAKACSTSD